MPSYINLLFTKSDAKRGKYPIGVYYNKHAKKFQAKCRINGKLKGLGYYNTIGEAFNTYKQAKEQEVKRIADECVEKGYMTENSRLCKAMIEYKVEIDD